MTEKARMLCGESYNSLDPELVQDRLRTRRLLQDYNQSDPGDTAARYTLLAELLTRPHSAWIEAPFFCDYGWNIYPGRDFYANFNCIILDVCRVVIGDQVLFGPAVQIYTATHPTDVAERLSGREMGREVHIGNHVWIGGGTVVCPGVHIGEGTTIGAGSVVTRDIPAGVVAAGNPCRVLRSL